MPFITTSVGGDGAGAPGPQGETGPQGPQGETGPQGPAGEGTVYLVRNNTASTILKGTLVSAVNAEPSGRIDVSPHETTGLENSELRVMGMATTNITNGTNGTVMSFGTLTGLDTRGSTASAIAVGDETWAAGDILYAHPTADGKLTNVRPQHDLAVAFITVRHASSGQIAIRIVPGNNHLEWMHDVQIVDPANTEVLAYDSASGLWKNQAAPSGSAASAATPTTLGTVFGLTNTENTAVGELALRDNTTGGLNTAIGIRALRDNLTGYENVAVGARSLENNEDGWYNTSLGAYSLMNNTSGHNHTSAGAESLYNNTTGTNNTAFGVRGLTNTTTGSLNTAIGNAAGSNMATGSNNTMIGNNAQASSNSVSNTVTFGNSSISTIRAAVTSITSLSDARDKKNIEPLSTGLNFVNSLNPVKFDWNMRDGGKIDVPDTGFIAQDLVILEDSTGIADYLQLTFRDNPDKLEASYGRLIPILVKAIQDLSNKVTELEQR
jgi:hypothetical protein